MVLSTVPWEYAHYKRWRCGGDKAGLVRAGATMVGRDQGLEASSGLEEEDAWVRFPLPDAG